MAGDAFGALATLPLYCLGDLPSSDPGAMVLSHYDIWHSCLVVARETLRADASSLEQMPPPLEDLLSTATELRDAYLALHLDGTADSDAASKAYRRLVAAYERLPVLIKQLGDELGLDASFVAPPQSLKRATYERTLSWLGEELRARTAQT